MKVLPKRMRKFQVGGEMAAPEEGQMAPEEQAAPVPEEQGGGQDPLMMLAQMSAQALQNQDCQAAMQVCQAFLQLIQQAQQGQGGAPEQPQGEPVYKKGGILVRRIRK